MGQNAGGYDNTDRGALFRNKKKESGDNRPDYTGTLDVGGVAYRVSAWIKSSQQTGEKFMSLAIQPKDQQKNVAPRPAAKPAEPEQQPFGEDDIPF